MSENLMGVIIGAVAAIVGGLVSAMLSNYHNRKMFMREEKRKTYELANEVLLEIEDINPLHSDNGYLKSKEFRDKCRSTQNKLILYAPIDIVELYARVLDILSSGDAGGVRYEEYKFYSELLVMKIRKDLGT